MPKILKTPLEHGKETAMVDEQIESLIEAIRSISHGPLSGPGAQPMGLELLAVSVGEVATALNRIADALES